MTHWIPIIIGILLFIITLHKKFFDCVQFYVYLSTIYKRILDNWKIPFEE